MVQDVVAALEGRWVLCHVWREWKTRTMEAISFNVAEWIRAPNSNSGASVQQSVGLNPGRDNCVPEQDT